MKNRLLLLLIVLFSSAISWAQNDVKRANDFYDHAQNTYKKGDLDRTEQLLRKAINADTSHVYAHLFLGDLYYEVKRNENALTHYKKALQIGFEPDDFYTNIVAEMEYWNGNYDSALHYFIKLDTLKLLPENRQKIINCRFASNALRHPVEFNPQNLGSTVNSEYSEYFPAITIDNKTLLFTRLIPSQHSNYATAAWQEDFFLTHRDSSTATWQTAETIGAPINTFSNEGAPTLSADGRWIFFTACAGIYGYGEEREGYGSCDFFVSERIGDEEWSKPQNLGHPVNSPFWESQPSLSADGRTLFFIRKTSLSSDIWKTTLMEDGSFKEPEPLDNNINTDLREESVFIHPDGKTLYFSSNGHPGMGGLDIFMTTLQPDGNWSTPKNLGYPINTINDENSLLISSDGKTAYFASNRPEGFGKLDLYSFRLPEESRPQNVTYLKGSVADAQHATPLHAKLELIDLKTLTVTTQAFSEGKTGKFLLTLPQGRYALNVTHPGYLFHSEHLVIDSTHTVNTPQHRDILLHTIEVGSSLILQNVFFDTDKSILKPESKAELNKVVILLEENPNVEIEIAGHTDSDGEEEYNLVLSEARAKAVFDFLIENGIENTRIVYKGYGEAIPIAPNSSEEGKALNRRTELTVTKIL